MMSLCCKALQALRGRTLVTAESCTGGGIGAALTQVAGSSEVFKGGVICYTNWVKQNVLGVPEELLEQYGAVSAPVAEAMAVGVRQRLQADVALSVTGLAGPDGDSFGKPVGTVYIGYCDDNGAKTFHFQFNGDRESVRRQAITAALELLL